ncbi:MAG: hypothetical protein L3J37_10495 [Rhodobacteraceae bacterium]|nr:hypothetical protein [Paracoccaceae bacterium]
MDLFILLGAGLLGSILLSSQINLAPVSFLWKFISGAGAGGVAYFILQASGKMPQDSNMGSLIFIFAIGGLSGAAGVLVYGVLRRWRGK